MRPARQTASSSRCNASPSSPVSAKPAASTISARTPRAAHMRATGMHCAAGTASTAASSSPGIASTEAKQWWPSTLRPRRLTAYRSPA